MDELTALVAAHRRVLEVTADVPAYIVADPSATALCRGRDRRGRLYLRVPAWIVDDLPHHPPDAGDVRAFLGTPVVRRRDLPARWPAEVDP